MSSTTLSIRLEQSEKDAIMAYANLHGKSAADIVRESLFEKLEDELDLHLYEVALAEYKKNPKTYTLEEVGAELGLL